MADTVGSLEKKLDVIACLMGLQLRGAKDIGEIAMALAACGVGQMEIAGILGIKPKAVENALYRARKKAM